MPEQSSNGSVPLDVVRQVVREEIAPLARDVTQLRRDVAQLAEGQVVLLQDMAEVKQAVRGHEARITALE